MSGLVEFYNDYKMKIKMIFCFLLILGIFGLIYFYYIKKDKENIVMENNRVVEEKVSLKEDEIDKIFVDIKGMVNNEGVYSVDSGKRVIDVIELAGGLKDGANTRFINLAKIVSDGEVIVIYSNDEIDKAKEPKIVYVDTPCVCEEIKNDACLIDNINKDNNGEININTSSAEELKTLDGIGEAKANSIIDYRNKNGNFKSIEDLLNVSGISEKIFNNIKDKITTD